MSTISRLEPLFRPRSIAVIGASESGTSAEILGNLERTGFDGGVVCVNPRRETIFGRPCHPTLAAVGRPVDVAAIAVKASRVPDALVDCVVAGARSAVVFADGFSDADPGGPALLAAVADIAARAALPVLGPNCMGVLAPAYGRALYIDRITRMPRPGRIGLVTQSGSVGVAGVNHTGTLALSAMISVGNEIGVSTAEAIDFLSTDGVTSAVAVFAEGIRDGAGLAAAARRAIGRGVPVVLCKTGRSAAAMRAAASHTGAMANDQSVLGAVLAASGVAVVGDIDELFAAAELLATGRQAGRRLAAVTLSGGHVGLISDVAAAAGLAFAAPDAGLHAALEAALGAARAVANPLDCWADGDVVGAIDRAAEAFAASSQYDGFLFAVDTPADPPTSFVEMGRSIAAVASRLARRDARLTAMISTSIAHDDPTVTATLVAAGVPRLAGLRPGLTAWAAIAGAAERTGAHPAVAAAPRGAIRVRTGSEPDTYRLLAELGIAAPLHRVCRDADAARAAARDIGFPVAVKIVSATVIHKTDVGGVVLGLRSEEEVAAAAARLLAIPGAEAVMVAEMVPGGIEAFVGAKTDAAFGPVVLVGMGGVMAELIGDIAVLPAPATPAEVISAVADLKLGTLMAGYRGAPAVDGRPLAEIASRLSHAISGADPALSIDLNPVRLVGDRAIVLDAKIVAAPDAGGGAP